RAAGHRHADRAGDGVSPRAARVYRSKPDAPASDRRDHRRHNRHVAGPPRQPAGDTRGAGIYCSFVIATKDQGRKTKATADLSSFVLRPSSLVEYMSTPTQPLFDSTFLRKLDRLALLTKRAMAGDMQGERRSPRRGS